MTSEQNCVYQCMKRRETHCLKATSFGGQVELFLVVGRGDACRAYLAELGHVVSFV